MFIRIILIFIAVFITLFRLFYIIIWGYRISSILREFLGMCNSSYSSCSIVPLSLYIFIFRFRLTIIVIILRCLWAIRTILRITLAIVLIVIQNKTMIFSLIDLLNFLEILPIYSAILVCNFPSYCMPSLCDWLTEIISIYDIHLCGNVMHRWTG